MRRRLDGLVLLALVLGSGALGAAEVSGTQVAERVQKMLTAIDWQPSLEAAKAKAKKEKKLVFWLQLVGDLDKGL